MSILQQYRTFYTKLDDESFSAFYAYGGVRHLDFKKSYELCQW